MDYQPGTTARRDRVIEVRTVDDGRWARVKWNRAFRRFLVIDGDGCWVWEAEVDIWRDAAHPSIGIGASFDELDLR